MGRLKEENGDAARWENFPPFGVIDLVEGWLSSRRYNRDKCGIGL